MSARPPRPVPLSGPVRGEVILPPSKSYTNRALLAAALADGPTLLDNVSRSQDSRYMIGALVSLGVGLATEEATVALRGSGGLLAPPRTPLFVGNAGTTFRFLTAAASLAVGEVTVTGDEQMRARPIGALCDALTQAGVQVRSSGGFPPVTVKGGTFEGGKVSVAADASSQFLSALLLVAPYARTAMEISIPGQLSSAPYVAMTLALMREFGAAVEEADGVYRVRNDHRYQGRHYTIEPDASAAGYLWAAAAITGGEASARGLRLDSLQGDVQFARTLEAMGCALVDGPAGLGVRGTGELRGIEVDMNAMPDAVPTLAVVALFAQGPTTIRNVAHLRHKETDRLAALGAELARLGADVTLLEDGLRIVPAPLSGCTIETYRDHRIAMSFALAGLRVPGVAIADPGCVAKSFPGFWEAFTTLTTESAHGR